MTAPTLRIEGLPGGWEVSLGGERAQRISPTPIDPVFLAVPGRVRFVAQKGTQRREALLAIQEDHNVVAWSEFRSTQKPAKRSLLMPLGVAVAAAGVVYFAGQAQR